LIVINSDVSSSGLYIPYTRHFPFARHNTISHSSPPVARPEPLRAQRSGEQASGTRRPASGHLLGCAGNQVFGERLPRLLAGEIDVHRLLPSCGSGSGSASSWCHRSTTFCGSVSSSDRLLRLLPGGRSWDYTTNIYLNRLRSTTLGNTLCRLV
jgi:hypothetical protein